MQLREQMETSELRDTVALVIREVPLPGDVVDAARETVRAALRQGAEFGLTDRDVVVALLRPVLTRERGCDCPTCKTRREQLRV